MNKKAYISGGQKLIVVLLVIISIFIVLYFLNILNLQEKTTSLFLSVKETTAKTKENIDKNKYDEFTPAANLDWCVPQEIPTTDDETSPKIISVDGINNIDTNPCCQKSFIGYNNCLNESVRTTYCFTSELGGKISYIRINNKYYNPQFYQTYIKDTVKTYNPNFRKEARCDLQAYN